MPKGYRATLTDAEMAWLDAKAEKARKAAEREKARQERRR